MRTQNREGSVMCTLVSKSLFGWQDSSFMLLLSDELSGDDRERSSVSNPHVCGVVFLREVLLSREAWRMARNGTSPVHPAPRPAGPGPSAVAASHRRPAPLSALPLRPARLGTGYSLQPPHTRPHDAPHRSRDTAARGASRVLRGAVAGVGPGRGGTRWAAPGGIRSSDSRLTSVCVSPLTRLSSLVSDSVVSRLPCRVCDAMCGHGTVHSTCLDT